ncbi:MAG: BatD family protein [Acidobacteria bacterium]|nr:BatD family protein [Acidobacteriota bacterium]
MSGRLHQLSLAALTAVALSVCAALAADAPTVSAEVDRKRIGTEDTLVLTVRIEGDGAKRVGAPTLADMDDFRVLRGPSVSSQFQWVNGRSRSFRTFTYVLQPLRQGALEIPEVILKVFGGGSVQTAPIEVEVVEGTVAERRRRTPRQGLTGPRQQSSSSNAKVNIEAELDRKSAFVGQQVTVVYRVYTQLDITGLELVNAPSYPGFWVEELKIDPNPLGRRAVREGESYIEYTVLKKALFPTRAGRLEIPALRFSLGVRGTSRDPFESLFFGSGQTVYRKSPPLALEVQPLPEEGRPASFSGAVGHYRLNVSPDRQEARVNDAISLRVRVHGEGNLRPVGEPAFPQMPDFKAYDPKVDEKIRIEGGRLKGSKTWDYVLLPLAPGSQEIPSIEFSYFDPDSARYQVLRSTPIRVQVERGELQVGTTVAGVQPREVRELRTDIRHLRPTPEQLMDRSRMLRQRAGFVAALAVPATANLVLMLAVWRRETRQAAPGELRRRRAARWARRALHHAAAAAKHSSAGFFEAVSKALRQYVADKLDRSAAGLTIREIENALSSAGVGAMDCGLVRSCLEACDRAQFAPSAARPAARAELVQQARSAVDNLEARL